MKKNFLSVFFSFFVFYTYSQEFKVATYNLRNENTYDVDDMWQSRYPYVAKLIAYHNFDLFGTQEALPGQLDDLREALSGFEYYGEGRDGNRQGEHAAIFYKTDKYTLLDKGDFWLSATPDVPSKSWDAPCCNRICTWIELEEKSTGNKFYVFNAHYDYEKDYARHQSSLLVLQKIEEIVGDKPVIFMGDLNGNSDKSWCKVLNESGVLRSTYFDVEEPYANSGSYNAFGKFDSFSESDRILFEEKQPIDHIYFSKHFKTKKWGLLTDTYNMRKYPSDHFPVVVDTSWAE